jgi:hypothetical protein
VCFLYSVPPRSKRGREVLERSPILGRIESPTKDTWISALFLESCLLNTCLGHEEQEIKSCCVKAPKTTVVYHGTGITSSKQPWSSFCILVPMTTWVMTPTQVSLLGGISPAEHQAPFCRKKSYDRREAGTPGKARSFSHSTGRHCSGSLGVVKQTWDLI